MDAKEARNITMPGTLIPVNALPKSEPEYENFLRAQGYIACLEGPEVRALVEAVDVARQLERGHGVDFKKYGFTCDADIGKYFTEVLRPFQKETRNRE